MYFYDHLLHHVTEYQSTFWYLVKLNLINEQHFATS